VIELQLQRSWGQGEKNFAPKINLFEAVRSRNKDFLISSSTIALLRARGVQNINAFFPV